ncbi:hypothetical protein [Chitinophaga barathri]|uniref:RES domain-containing protein n=1 Tax=Chitinophaga barathri TaxID=1647451 RepID=A0A3N4MGX4_9BACT|nr:hypothetical protein [Chitinophaga barathri]RPD41276.1 hypothetical protein EG028_11405 [Chitinophaga barathri]
MKLFRFAHENVAHLLVKDALLGCSLHSGSPFFYAFDSVPSAIIESPVYTALGEIPPKILTVEYTVPEGSLYVMNQPGSPVHGDYSRGNYYLGEWVSGFLKKNAALLAAYPSKHWVWQQNYIVNPKHELFRQVRITDIRSIHRK